MRAQRADWANLQYYSVYSIMNVMNGVLVVTLLGYRVPSKTTNLGEYQIRYYIIHYFNVLFHFNTIPYYMCQDYTTTKQNNKLPSLLKTITRLFSMLWNAPFTCIFGPSRLPAVNYCC